MSPLLETLLGNAVLVVPIALLVWVASRVLRRPAITHALWVLVLVKLVTPAITRLPLFELTPAAPPPLHRSDGEPGALAGTMVFVPSSEAGGAAEADVPAGAREATSQPRRATGTPGWGRLLLALWVAGSLLILGGTTCRVLRFRRVLRLASRDSRALQRAAERLAARFGLARCPRVTSVRAQLSPMLWAGLGRPILVLPDALVASLGDAERDSLLAHELAHYRRRDHWVRWFELLVAAGFWWHPVFWLARRELRRTEEECCDAWVVEVLPGRSRAYADTLLDVVDFLSAAGPSIPVGASGMGHVRNLQRRLTMIMEERTRQKLSARSRLLLLLFALFVLPVFPIGAQERRSPESELRRVTEQLETIERRVAERLEAGKPEAARELRQEARELKRILERLRQRVGAGEQRRRRREGREEVIEEIEEEEMEEEEKEKDEDEEEEMEEKAEEEIEEQEERIAELHERMRDLMRQGKAQEAREVAERARRAAQDLRERQRQRDRERRERDRARRRRDRARNADRRRRVGSRERRDPALQGGLAGAMRNLDRAIQALEGKNPEVAAMLREVRENLRAGVARPPQADRAAGVGIRRPLDRGRDGGSQRRIANLEARLDALRAMVEELRAELTRLRGSRRGSGR